MKKVLVLLLVILVFTACKNDAKPAHHIPEAAVTEQPETTVDKDGRTTKQSDGLTLLKGEFVYFADTAVLQTHREVYGVVVDANMEALNAKVQQYKKEPTDMVPVEIRGKIVPKPEGEEGWPFRVEIKEILNVYKPNENKKDVIKLN